MKNKIKILILGFSISTISVILFGCLLVFLLALPINVILPTIAPIWGALATITFLSLKE